MRVDDRAWFFAAHFHQDPVMPGSLGLEAIFQAMRAYALQLDLGRPFCSPRFGLAADHLTVWKYRGQITPDAGQMDLEVDMTRLEERDGRVTLLGDASVWCDGLRIYEVRDAAICLAEDS
jgi:3-hydroxymyristoyl/3-hydroxydecanoyl-(acyl carrier protein) dehydratase